MSLPASTPASAPLVSVLLCSFNSLPFLDAALRSVLCQRLLRASAAAASAAADASTDDSFEVVVVDDGSTDGSSALIDSIAASDARVVVVRNARNQGLARSLALGLERCRGDLVARMDADDIAVEGRLQQQVDFMRAHPAVDVVGSAVEVFQEAAKNDAAASSADASAAAASSSAAASAAPSVAASSRVITHPSSAAVVFWSSPFFCPVAHPSVMFRRSAVAAAGGYREEWEHAEDYELWLRMQRDGAQVANQPQVLLRLRKHGSNVSSRSSGVQRLHSLLAVQSHLSTVLRAPIDLAFVRAIREPATLRCTGAVATTFHLLCAWEAHCVGRCTDEADKKAIRSDCTARLGELVALAMKLEGDATPAADLTAAAPSTSAAATPLYASPPRPNARHSFSLPLAPTAGLASQLMRQWMMRGPEAAMLLGKLMRK